MDDLKGKARVSARVQRESRQVVAVVVQNLGDPVLDITLDGLAFAEHLARHRIERIILHAHKGPPQEIDSVEHHAPGNRRLPTAKIPFGLAQADGSYIATQVERMPGALGDSFQHREIEVNGVPTRQHVRIESTNPLAKGVQRRALVKAPCRSVGHRAIAAVDDQYLVQSGCVD